MYRLRALTRQLSPLLVSLEGVLLSAQSSTNTLLPVFTCASWQRLKSSSPQAPTTYESPFAISKAARLNKQSSFDLRRYITEGATEKSWGQLLAELKAAESQGHFLHPADVNRLVLRCSMSGNHKAALEIHRYCKHDKCWPGRYLKTRRKNDVAIRASNILLGLFHNEESERALKLIAELTEDVGSRHTLFDLLLLQCAKNGDDSLDERGDGVRWLTVEDGLLVVNIMLSIGVQPTRIGMEALIDCCDAALDAETAEEIVNKMEEDYGLPPTVITIIRLLRACVNAGDEERALRVIGRLPREDLRTRDMQLLVTQTLLLQYEQAAESREAAEAPESMPRLRRKLDALLAEIQKDTRGTSAVPFVPK